MLRICIDGIYMTMSKQLQFLCCLLLTFLLANTSSGQTVNARITLQNQQGSLLRGGAILLKGFDSSATQLLYSETYVADSNGVVQVPDRQHGTHALVFISPQPAQLLGDTVYYNDGNRSDAFLSFDTALGVNGVQNFAPVVADLSATRFWVLDITEGMQEPIKGPLETAAIGDPLPGINVDASFGYDPSDPDNPAKPAPPDGWISNFVSNAVGKVHIPIPQNAPLGQKAFFNIKGSPSYEDLSFAHDIQLASGREPMPARKIPFRNVTGLTYELVNQDLSPFYTSSDLDQPGAYLYCSLGGNPADPNSLHSPYYSFSPITPGSDRITLDLAAGYRECLVILDGYASEVAKFDLNLSSPKTNRISLVPKLAAVDFSLTISDPAGNLLAFGGIDAAFINLWLKPDGQQQAPQYNSYDSAEIKNGQSSTTFQLLSNRTYEAFVDVLPSPNLPSGVFGFGAGGKLFEFTTGADNSSVSVSYALSALDAELVGTLPWGEGFVEVSCEGSILNTSGRTRLSRSGNVQILAAAFDPGSDLWFGGRTNNSTIRMPVASGRSCEARAFPIPNLDPNSPPAPAFHAPEIKLELNAGESRSIEFELPQRDVDLTVKAKLKDSSGNEINGGTVQFYGAFAENGLGYGSFLDTFDGNLELKLPLRLGPQKTPYFVGAHAVHDDGQNIKYYRGSMRYEQKGRLKPEDTIELELVEFSDYLPEEIFEISAQSAITLTFSDGNQLYIPAGAISSNSSSEIEVIVKGAEGYRITEQETPFKTYDITITADGEEVTELLKPITLLIQVNPEELQEKLGINTETLESLLSGQSYEEESDTWRNDGSIIYDADTGILKISLEHLSIWGSLVSISKQLKSLMVTGLSKKILNKNSSTKKKKVRLCWDALSGADGSQAYELQYYKKTKKSKKLEDPWSTLAKTKTAIGKTCLEPQFNPGKYGWRVRIEDGEQWSEEKGLTVK